MHAMLTLIYSWVFEVALLIHIDSMHDPSPLAFHQHFIYTSKYLSLNM